MTIMVDGQEIDPNQVGEGELTEQQLVYKENILDHYRNPRNRRVIENPTTTFKDMNPLCGDEIQAFVVIEDGKITDVSFQGKGCAISQASMSMLTRNLKGKSIDEIMNLGQDHVLNALGIPIGVVRRKCAMLGLRVIQKALQVKNEA